MKNHQAKTMKYTQKQIKESISYWKRVLEDIEKKETFEESEDTFDKDLGVIRSSAREMIFDDAPADVEVVDAISYRDLNRLPFQIDQSLARKMQQAWSENSDYRAMIYYVKSKCEYQFEDADQNIDDETDYNNYIDRESQIWRYNQEDFDDLAGEFLKRFPTYQKWIEYKSSNSKRNLISSMRSSRKIPYQSIDADDVYSTEDGTAYTVILWRA